jgi:hypothetical protein
LFFSQTKKESFTMPAEDARITELEGRVHEHSDVLTAINQSIAELSRDFQRWTDRAVTWKSLITGVLIPVVVGVAACILGAAAISNSSYNNRIPKDVEYGISNSLSLKKSFDSIETHFAKIDGTLSEISKTLGDLANSGTISAGLKDAVSVRGSLLAKTLPNARRLLSLARNLKVQIPSKTYKTVYRRLFDHYNAATAELKPHVWEALIDCANTRTFTDAVSYPLTDSDIQQSAGNYFEGEIDLSSRTEWKDAIFRNCKITISAPRRGLNLVHVRFVDCEFDLPPSDIASARLVETVLQTPKPAFDIPHFRVLPPRYRPNSSASSGD